MPAISTHVLDTAKGKPAAGVSVSLAFLQENEEQTLAETMTDEDGRVADLLGGNPLQTGIYRLTFQTGDYGNALYPEVSVMFRVDDPNQSLHLPLLLSPFGYTTYRGS